MKGRGEIYAVILALSWLFIVAIPLSASIMEGAIGVQQTDTFPIRIDRPGNYVLLSNLIVSTPETPCIQINADDVILDLQGHSLTGPDGGQSQASAGIQSSSGNSNIAVRNGTIEGFYYGVHLTGANHEVEKITISSCDVGIKAEFSIITNCTVHGNGSQGIEARECSIINCTANQNGSYGLKAESCTVINCSADQNGSHGLYSLGKCRLEGCAMIKNGQYGLYLSQDHNYAKKNILSDNTSGGVYMDGLHYLSTSDDKTSNKNNENN
ncbi:MAG: right-handed parallel beta-helix repeat-containing protein [bacterium]